MNAPATTATTATASTTTRPLMNAVWFSRHSPTPEQVADAEAMGFRITGEVMGMRLGARSIESQEDLVTTLHELRAHAQANMARAIFGVFPTPLLAAMANTAETAVHRGDWCPRDLACFASWNVSRSPEGGRPTFTHHKWLHVGSMNPPENPRPWFVGFPDGTVRCASEREAWFQASILESDGHPWVSAPRQAAE